MTTNPLLDFSGLPRFDTITPAHVAPAIGSLLRVTKGRDTFVLPLFMYLFATASAFFGMFEEAFGFIPIFVGLAIAMGYDAIVGPSTASAARRVARNSSAERTAKPAAPNDSA